MKSINKSGVKVKACPNHIIQNFYKTRLGHAALAPVVVRGAKATFQNQVGFWKANVNVPGSTKTENINKPGTLTIRNK